MGQVLGVIQDNLQGRQWKERQVRKITDKVFDHFKDDSKTTQGIAFQDLYIAVLCVYNDINKHLPGPHYDPPSKEKLKSMMVDYDVDLDGLLEREEFAEFIRKLTKDALASISLKLVIAMVVAPTIAIMTKRATEKVPGVGPVVQRVPNSVYASLVTLGVVLAQRNTEDCV